MRSFGGEIPGHVAVEHGGVYGVGCRAAPVPVLHRDISDASTLLAMKLGYLRAGNQYNHILRGVPSHMPRYRDGGQGRDGAVSKSTGQ
jgi:hypothetical protein